MSTTLSGDARGRIAVPVTRGRHLAPRGRSRLRALGTMPVQLVGSFVVKTMTGTSETHAARRGAKQRPETVVVVTPPAAIAATPAVVALAGESIADLAQRLGVSTASLLALNGLSWRSVIAEGDVVQVPKARAAAQSAVADEVARHAVASGESVGRIASDHGISTAALLLANGMSRGSAIRTGQHLVIPMTGARRLQSGEVLTLAGEMRANAARIVATGRALGLPDDAVVIALTAAMQDSSLRNLDCGEFDALGLFQQRPSAGWGTTDDILDTDHAIRAFFGGAGSPVRGRAAGLLDHEGWELMSIGEAACAVQGTGTPRAYGKWEDSARGWAAEL